MRIDIHHFIHHVSKSELEQTELLKEILNLNKITVATLAELSAKITELEQTVNDEQQEIANALAELQTEVTRLTDLIAAGGTPEELQAEVDKVQAIIEDVKSTIPNLPEPEPGPPVEPEV